MTWYSPRTGPDEREPRPVIDSLDAMTCRLGVPAAGVLAAIFARWAETVGPDIAAHSSPRSLRAGILVIEVDQPAWATQLRYLSAEVLGKIREAAGPEGVQELQIKVAAVQTRAEGRRSSPRSRPDTPL